MRSPLSPRPRLHHPAQLVVVAFAVAILVGTAVLMLPVASEAGDATGFVTALFTATSAICVTGLIVVDTASYFSTFGEVAILVMVQVGGFGIMTLASLLGLFAFRRIGLRRRMLAQAETGTLQLGDVRRVLLGVAAFTAAFEVVAAALLAVRFWWAYDYGLGRGLYHGVFHSVTAFNNAGFALYVDNLIPFVTDAWVSLTIATAVILGGIGFPVLLELRRNPTRPRRWTLHTKLVLVATGVLIVGGTSAVLLFEWTNPATLGPLPNEAKVLAGFFQGVSPRTAGFNTIDYADVRETTLLVTDVLMFIGAAPASTGGGIKVTTFALLGYVIWSEVRGEPDVVLFGRRSPNPAQRQALAVALLGVATVVGGTFLLLVLSPGTFPAVLFEAFSAFGTVGLSTGVTGALPDPAKMVLVVLMFLGRVGPTTLGAALVLRERRRLYRFPEERTIVG